MLSKLLLNEFKTIIKKDYNKDLSNQEVSQMANTLVDYFDLLAKVLYKIKEKVKSPDLLPIKK